MFSNSLTECIIKKLKVFHNGIEGIFSLQIVYNMVMTCVRAVMTVITVITLL